MSTKTKSHEESPLEFTEVTPEQLLEIVNEADEQYADIGGTNEVWVKQCLLPILQRRKILIVTKS